MKTIEKLRQLFIEKIEFEISQKELLLDGIDDLSEKGKEIHSEIWDLIELKDRI